MTVYCQHNKQNIIIIHLLRYRRHIITQNNKLSYRRQTARHV